MCLVIQSDEKVSVYLMITVNRTRKNIFKHFQSLIMITWLGLAITDGVSVSLVSEFGVSLNVWMQAGDTSNITFNFLYCNHEGHAVA
jgi:hypothetical protein